MQLQFVQCGTLDNAGNKISIHTPVPMALPGTANGFAGLCTSCAPSHENLRTELKRCRINKLESAKANIRLKKCRVLATRCASISSYISRQEGDARDARRGTKSCKHTSVRLNISRRKKNASRSCTAGWCSGAPSHGRVAFVCSQLGCRLDDNIRRGKQEQYVCAMKMLPHY